MSTRSFPLFHRALAVVALGLPVAPTAVATQITVTGTGDSIALDGFVTLREAMTAASTNAASGDAPAGQASATAQDLIRFNISGLPGTVQTIAPASALPTITDSVTIDGYTQLGASANTLEQGNNAFLAIEIDGTDTNFVAGLTISANNSTVQGLVINRFDNEGILIIGTGNVIRGNFLGTDQTGKLDRGNGVSGVTLLSNNNRVGGTAPADRNLISGNDFSGVGMSGAGVTGNRIEGNFIGTDDTGTVALGNTGSGVRVLNVTNNSVGGIEAGAANVIAFNTGPGIAITSSGGPGNELIGNSVHSNGALGIDLNADGVTANDANDADGGPNNRQNYPVLSQAVVDAGETHAQFRLDTPVAALGQDYRISLYSSETCDPSTYGEGERYLGTVQITATALEIYNVRVPVAAPPGHLAVTATATDPSDNTSEFSACRTRIDGFAMFKNGFEG